MVFTGAGSLAHAGFPGDRYWAPPPPLLFSIFINDLDDGIEKAPSPGLLMALTRVVSFSLKEVQFLIVSVLQSTFYAVFMASHFF